MNLYNIYTEAELAKKERDKLSDEDFGLKEKRQYPMPDAEHVRKAIQMFKHCDEKHRKELASRIFNKAMQFGVKISKNSEIFKYLGEKHKDIMNKKIEKLNEALIFNNSMDFQKFPITEEIIDSYSWCCPELLRLKLNDTKENEERYDGTIVVDLHSQVVGYIQIDKVNQTIVDIFVNPYYRHQGIASEFLSNMAYQYEMLKCNVFRENYGMIEFLKKNNFEVINETPHQLLFERKSELNEMASVSGLATPTTLAQPTIRNKYTPMFDWDEFFEEEESLFINY